MSRPAYGIAIAGTALCALCACATGDTAQISPQVPRGDFVLRAAGAGDWRVECTVDTARGRTALAEMDGRGSTDSDVIVVRSAIGGSCAYSAADGPLTLTVEGGDMACPFESSSPEFCRSVVAPGTTGTVDVSPE